MVRSIWRVHRLTIRAAVFAFLDQHEVPFTFTATFVEYIAMKYTGLYKVSRKHVIRCLHDYCDRSGAKLKTVIRREGIYHFTPGVRLGNAIVD